MKSTKREELSHILDQFNIQVDNPVAILNQDTSRNFLHSIHPGDKYKVKTIVNTNAFNKVLVLIYKVLHDTNSPSYLCELIRMVEHSRYHRSMDNFALVVPACNLQTVGGRSFSVSGMSYLVTSGVVRLSSRND